jgi:hypothetical protein
MPGCEPVNGHNNLVIETATMPWMIGVPFFP